MNVSQQRYKILDVIYRLTFEPVLKQVPYPLITLKIRGTVLLTQFHFAIYSLNSQDPTGMSEQVRVLRN